MNARRRFMASLGGTGMALALQACRKPVPPAAPPATGVYHWSGIGFGIEMSMEIHEVDEPLGESLGTGCERIIAELEQAFSLYREDSELSRLNRERELPRPSETFVGLLDLSISLAQRTLGYCQPAIHGAWNWLQQHDFRVEPAQQAEWQRLCAAADTRHIERNGDGAVRLSHPLTQLSMNAVGQGYLADRVAAMLREHGVKHALLHLGETHAIGTHPQDRPWKLAVMGTGQEPDLIGEMELADAGLAVSANEPGRLLIDPVGASLLAEARVAAVVSGEGATVADAFATAFAIAPDERWSELEQNLIKNGTGTVRLWRDNRQTYPR